MRPAPRYSGGVPAMTQDSYLALVRALDEITAAGARGEDLQGYEASFRDLEYALRKLRKRNYLL